MTLRLGQLCWGRVMASTIHEGNTLLLGGLVLLIGPWVLMLWELEVYWRLDGSGCWL